VLSRYSLSLSSSQIEAHSLKIALETREITFTPFKKTAEERGRGYFRKLSYFECACLSLRPQTKTTTKTTFRRGRFSAARAIAQRGLTSASG